MVHIHTLMQLTDGGSFLIGRWVVQWLWVIVRVRRWHTAVCVCVCRPLKAPINISVMVYVLPVGIDPCFYFPISSHLWLERVVWYSYTHEHTRTPFLSPCFSVLMKVELSVGYTLTGTLPHNLLLKRLVLLLQQPTALCLFVIVT